MVCGNITSVCGWEELFDANLIGASFIMFNDAFVGWVVVILFFVYQFMLLLKTRNLTISFITGLMFASMYAVTLTNIVKPITVQVLFLILVFELAGILYLWIWK